MAVLKVSRCGIRYVASLYFVFNALENGMTTSERGFAVFAELCVGFIFGALAGLMSSVMITLRGNQAEVGNALHGLNIWLRKKKIPREQHGKIMDYFHSLWSSQNRLDPAKLMSDMPPTMACEVRVGV
jgi:hypothetical protein